MTENITGTDAATSAAPIRSDRILPVTRWVAVIIVPFLVAAAVLLFGLPARSGELFAWQIDPPLSAFMLASAYVGGIWFFGRVAFERRWHRVAPGYPAVTVFAAALMVATLLHLDRFSDNISFWTWLVLYATTPFIVAALWAIQRRYADPRPDDPETLVPGWVRWAVAIVGTGALVFGALMWIAPDAIIPHWAWELTPLTAKVVGAVLSLTAVVGYGMLADARWSSFRILFQAQLVSLAAIIVSLILGAAALRPDRPMTWAFLALIASAALLYLALTVWMERRLRTP
ncbi:hypothetical protein P0L94_10020 [Microbacter sp. GSS18]|nr:hypothetical protein P0L94_10020 [Microbacter sp. GSS18]